MSGSNQVHDNISTGHSIQINGPVYGNIGASDDLQPKFWKTSNYDAYKNMNPERVPNTCLWFLEHETFTTWRDSNKDELLWLSADPGCGKSVLCRALIDENLLGPDLTATTVCHFFFKENSEQNNTAIAFCALLHQLFCKKKHLQRYATEAISNNGSALKNEFEKLWKIFISAATDPAAGDVICVLDALDECQQLDRDKLITSLERFYVGSVSEGREVQANRGAKLKFLVTGRPYDEIKRAFFHLQKNIPTIRFAAEDEPESITREIGFVIEKRVDELAERLDLTDDARTSLHEQLCETTNRTYLWLHLVLNEVENVNGRTKKKILQLFRELPSTVEGAYEKILGRCKEMDARKTLQIIVAAGRPLTLSEIDAALEVYDDAKSHKDLDLEGAERRKDWIRRTCGLFVSVVDSRVLLFHQTAKEFLLRKKLEDAGPQRWRNSIDLQEAHRVLAKICVTYLRLPEIQRSDHTDPWGVERRKLDLDHPFLTYSSKYWEIHTKAANMSNPTDISATIEVAVWAGQLSTLHNVSYMSESFQPRLSDLPLYWTVAYGLFNETAYLIENYEKTDEEDSHLEYVLIEAISSEHLWIINEDIMSLFFDRIGYGPKTLEKLISRMIQNVKGRVGPVPFIFEQEGERVMITEDALVAIAANTRCGDALIASLLDRKRDMMNITEDFLYKVAETEYHRRELMALILERGQVNIQIKEKVIYRLEERRSKANEKMRSILDLQVKEGLLSEEMSLLVLSFIHEERFQ